MNMQNRTKLSNSQWGAAAVCTTTHGNMRMLYIHEYAQQAIQPNPPLDCQPPLLLLPVDRSRHRLARGAQHGCRAEECLPDMERKQGYPESKAASVKG